MSASAGNQGWTEDNPHVSEWSKQIVSNALEAILATDSDAIDNQSGLEDDSSCTVRSFTRTEWLGFCSKVDNGQAQASCVIDFAYEDRGGLNLMGDQRLVERMYCFHDQHTRAPDQKLTVVHAHTVIPWGVRLATPAPVMMNEITSVNARHANKCNGTFVQEQAKHFIVPGSKNLQYQWRGYFSSGKKHVLVWRLDKKGSIPSMEHSNFLPDYET
jgi:hypothetical protein